MKEKCIAKQNQLEFSPKYRFKLEKVTIHLYHMMFTKIKSNNNQTYIENNF